MSAENRSWLALMIGNSRLHWAWFDRSTLKQTWDTPHLSTEAVARLIQHRFDFNCCFPDVCFPGIETFCPALEQSAAVDGDCAESNCNCPIPLWIASVVPSQTQLWCSYSNLHLLTLEQIRLGNLYPTIGIDRALALSGAVHRYGSPVLVIDAGTALTLTGANAEAELVGGAILPGLRLQLHSLAQGTAALPSLDDRLAELNRSPQLPPRWASNTADAMLSGVIYTLLAGLTNFVQAWQQDYPTSSIVLTGGDSQLLWHCWEPIGSVVKLDRTVVFGGMQVVVQDNEEIRKKEK
jgi:type III pantothenate kinase